MKRIVVTLLLTLPLIANALVIDSPSAAISFSGVGDTVDILDGADILAGSGGDSLSFSGLNNLVNISGGTLQGGIGFSGFDHVFNISGGSIFGDIGFSGFDHIFNITGGLFNGSITGSGYDHIFNFTGYDLVLNSNNVSGYLLDGSAIDLDISGAFIDAQINITNIASVSEPSSIVLLALGLLALITRSRQLR